MVNKDIKPSPYQWGTYREGYTVLIRTTHPRFAIEVQDEAESKQLADALRKAAEFVVKGRQGADGNE